MSLTPDLQLRYLPTVNAQVRYVSRQRAGTSFGNRWCVGFEVRSGISHRILHSQNNPSRLQFLCSLPQSRRTTKRQRQAWRLKIFLKHLGSCLWTFSWTTQTIESFHIVNTDSFEFRRKIVSRVRPASSVRPRPNIKYSMLCCLCVTQD